MKSSLLAPMTAQRILKSSASAMSLLSLLLATPLSLLLPTSLSTALTPLSLQDNAILFNTPSPPPDQGAPSGRQVGGAGRGTCHDYAGLTALMPVVDGVVWGQTTTNQGIWHDTLTILVELNRHHPSNPQVSAMLAALLTQAGLEEITAIQIGG